MKTNPNQTKLKLLLLCALSASALNLPAFAVNLVVDGTAHPPESDGIYESTAGESALAVRNNGSYTGTNIRLISSFDFTYGANVTNQGRLILTNANIYTGSGGAYGIYLTGTSTATVNNVYIMTKGSYSYGVYAISSTLTLTSGTITTDNNNAHGINLLSSTATVSNVTIETKGGDSRGVYLNSSTLTLTDSDISATGNSTYALYLSRSTGTASLTGNTLTGNIGVSGTSSLTLNGSQDTVITSTITVSGTGSALHGVLDFKDTSNIALTLGSGALFDGSGELNNLTLQGGAIIGYTGTLRVTDSITIGNGITIDFSALTETGTYTVLDWSGATESSPVTAGQFNLAADTGVEGTFAVQNGQLTFTANAIPEPSTYFLIGTGLGLLLLTARCRRKVQTNA